MPAPRMRDISISRAKPAIRLTIVSPPIVPVALWRFISRSAAPASGVRGSFGRRRLARAVVPATLLLLKCLQLREIRAGEVDRIEQQRREAGVRDRLRHDLPRERKDQP